VAWSGQPGGEPGLNLTLMFWSTEGDTHIKGSTLRADEGGVHHESNAGCFVNWEPSKKETSPLTLKLGVKKKV